MGVKPVLHNSQTLNPLNAMADKKPAGDEAPAKEKKKQSPEEAAAKRKAKMESRFSGLKIVLSMPENETRKVLLESHDHKYTREFLDAKVEAKQLTKEQYGLIEAYKLIGSGFGAGSNLPSRWKMDPNPETDKAVIDALKRVDAGVTQIETQLAGDLKIISDWNQKINGHEVKFSTYFSKPNRGEVEKAAAKTEAASEAGK